MKVRNDQCALCLFLFHFTLLNKKVFIFTPLVHLWQCSMHYKYPLNTQKLMLLALPFGNPLTPLSVTAGFGQHTSRKVYFLASNTRQYLCSPCINKFSACGVHSVCTPDFFVLPYCLYNYIFADDELVVVVVKQFARSNGSNGDFTPQNSLTASVIEERRSEGQFS